MTDDIYSFDEGFEPEDFEDVQRRFREYADRKETVKKHPAGKTATPQLSDEANTYLGLAVFRFLFVTIPLALLFAGLAVQPLFETAWGIDLGFWTAFLLLMTLRWLIPRPRKAVPLEKLYEQKGR